MHPNDVGLVVLKDRQKLEVKKKQGGITLPLQKSFSMISKEEREGTIDFTMKGKRQLN